MKTLSARETACLEWVAAGKTSYEIGVILGISARTVDYHIHNACSKMGVHSRQTAATLALERGLFPTIAELLPPDRRTSSHERDKQVRIQNMLNPAVGAVPAPEKIPARAPRTPAPGRPAQSPL